MTQTIRPLTPSSLSAAAKFTLANPTITASSTVVVDCNLDRTMLFGSPRTGTNNVLRKSLDQGRTWTDAATFTGGAAAGSETVSGVVNLPNGEILVSTNGTSFGYVYKSSGWAANPATATFALKLTTRGGSFSNVWGFNNKCVSSDPSDGTVFISVYNGGQTSSGGTDASNISKARYCYLSVDFGETFALVYDVYLQPQAPNAQGCHIHAVCYDKLNKRLWITFGDSTGAASTVAGAGNMYLAYSDNWATNPTAPTWNYVPIPAVLVSTVPQCTSIMVTATHLILLPDLGVNYIIVFPFSAYRTLGSPRLGQVTGINGPVGKHLNRATPTSPILAAFNDTAGYLAGGYPSIQVTLDGYTWYTLYKDTASNNIDNRAFANVICHMANGEIVTDYAGAIFRATLVSPTA